MRKSNKDKLRYQVRLFLIALGMIPLCWLIMILFFLIAAPQLTSDTNGQDIGKLLMYSLVFSLLPGVFMAGAVYMLLQTFFGKNV